MLVLQKVTHDSTKRNWSSITQGERALEMQSAQSSPVLVRDSSVGVLTPLDVGIYDSVNEREKTDKCDCIQLNDFCSSKGIIYKRKVGKSQHKRIGLKGQRTAKGSQSRIQIAVSRLF